MARCRLLQLAMQQLQRGYSKLSAVVVEWLAGRIATPAMQASFAQQCVRHGQTCENLTRINAVAISDIFNYAIYRPSHREIGR